SQRAMADLLSDPQATTHQRLFLLDTIEECAVKEFPAAWIGALRQQLAGKDSGVRARVVAIIRSRQLTAFDDELDRIGSAQTESKDLRLAALGVLVSRRPLLTDPSFQFL